MEVRKRDITIDWIKFIAVFLIINSHADIMYPHLKILATGGAIGDCFFLFSSGFTLFSGKQADFGSYYKRRISRIYPSVFVAVLFVHFIRARYQVSLFEFIGKPFIQAIMIYYIVLFFIRKYAIKKIKPILVFVGIVSLVFYIFWFPYKYDTSSKGLYGIATYYRWIPYFGAMLIGAYMGKNKESFNYNIRVDGLLLMACLILFYSIQYVAKIYRPIAPLQIVTLIPLMGIVVYMYKCCNNSLFKRIYQHKNGNFIVMSVGGLCLESYLIQGCLFTTKMNSIWPLNLFIITVVILISAYFVRCCARTFLQTFQTECYNWKKVFSFM